jgi:dTDP-4-dehydrorhamnose 3,5-epimerase
MKFIKGELEGLYIIEPTIYTDDRGYFYESYRKDLFKEKTGFLGEFVQDNESYSTKNVLRGLHFQLPPFAQAKLVRVIHGEVLDVAVDIRKNSPTFGQHQKVVLSCENKRMFFIPEGFAHGFLTLSEIAVFSYKCSNLYAPKYEGGFAWNDPVLKIEWTEKNPIVSSKDAQLRYFDIFTNLK